MRARVRLLAQGAWRTWVSVMTVGVLWLAGERAALAEQLSSNDVPADGYVARDASIVQVFDALSTALGKPIVASPSARRKRVTGRFDLTNARRVLDRLCADFGLVSYFDGNVIYVYDTDEMTNAVGSLQAIDVGTLKAFLASAGIAAEAFPVRGEAASHTFYVAGPPVFVDAVLAAARHLDHADVQTDAGQSVVKVIPLMHSFVRDRVFRLRDQTISVPGVARVLSDMIALHPDTRADEGVQVESSDVGAASAAVANTGPASDKAVHNTADNSIHSPTGRALRPESAVAVLPPIPDAMMPSAGPVAKISRAIRVSEQPVVLAYPDTNSLLVKGSAADVDYLSRLVSQLDVEKSQIELSLWIIDISQSTLEQLGVRWQGALGSGPVGVTFNADGSAIAGGLSTLDGARFLASVFALSARGDAQIVSRPLILTQENVPAIFDNNRTFYAKLIGERTSDLEQITYGTLVSVIPRLSVDHGEIEMILDIEDGNTVDASGNSGTVDGLPVVGRTHISTIARVPREMSLLIGGYTRHVVSQDVTKVPLLGDIPLLGNLFRYTHSNASDLVRVFLIQPRVLASREVWRGEGFVAPPSLAPGWSLDTTTDRLHDAVTKSVDGQEPKP